LQNNNNKSSIYDELNKLTLEDLYASFEKPTVSDKSITSQKKEVSAEDCLYDKSYICPICGNNFKSKTVRKGKVRFINNELDLKPIYEPIQPDYYDIVLCDKCGYTAMSSKFDKLTNAQEELIKTNITPKFFPKQYPVIYDVDVAIERYKLALINSIVKKGRAGEKAYICLKLAWFYRDKADLENEIMYLKASHKGFNEAFVNDRFPICGLEENTTLYIIAAIGSRIGKIDDSLRILSRLIVKRGLNARLKSKVSELREILKKIKR